MTHNTSAPVADKALAERLARLKALADHPDQSPCDAIRYDQECGDAHRSGQLITLAEADARVAALEAENAELKRQLGGGCDAANGGEHVVMIEGKGRSRYAFCIHCGESMVGVRYNHEPRAAATGIKEGM